MTLVADRTYRAVIVACRALLRLWGVRVELCRVERLPASGPVVIAANHSSFADFVLVGLAGTSRGRRVRFLAKESVFRAPVAGPVMRAMRHIPVDRSRGVVAARSALRALQAGEVVGIYPEATIGRAFVVKEADDFKAGAAYLAAATSAPLVPVAHWGVHRILTVGGRFGLRRGTAVLVEVGEPMVPVAGETAEQLTLRLQETLARMVDTLIERYPQPPRRPGAWWWPADRGGGAPSRLLARTLDAGAVLRADRRQATGAGSGSGSGVGSAAGASAG